MAGAVEIRIGYLVFMRITLLTIVLVLCLGFFYLNLTDQGLLYQQTKATQQGQTILTCKYTNALGGFEIVSRYETWAYPDKACDILTSTLELG